MISLCARSRWSLRPVWKAGIGVAIGAVIMVVGYTFGRAYLYGTPEYAVLKLPYQILQAAVGAVMGVIISFAFLRAENRKNCFNDTARTPSVSLWETEGVRVCEAGL